MAETRLNRSRHTCSDSRFRRAFKPPRLRGPSGCRPDHRAWFEHPVDRRARLQRDQKGTTMCKRAANALRTRGLRRHRRLIPAIGLTMTASRRSPLRPVCGRMAHHVTGVRPCISFYRLAPGIHGRARMGSHQKATGIRMAAVMQAVTEASKRRSSKQANRHDRRNKTARSFRP